MWRLLFATGLVACSAVDSGSEPAFERGGPPGAWRVTATPFTPGDVAWLVLSGATPGESAVFFGSATVGQGPCGPNGGACLSLVNPIRLGTAVVDSTGVAELRVDVPRQVPSVFSVQAAPAGAAGDASNVHTDAMRSGVDADEDYLDDAREVYLGTDPAVADGDGDGILDGVEVLRGDDPWDPDQDGDGILDGDDLDLSAPGPFQVFVPNDVAVSAPNQSLPDPEFDNLTHRIVWQDDPGAAVWVADLDPATGAIVPPHGRGERVTTSVARIAWGQNGPEWMHTDRGAEVVYATRTGPNARLGRAWESPGGWVEEIIPGTDGAAGPLGTLIPGDPDPGLAYVKRTPGGLTTRVLAANQPATNQETPRLMRFLRWMPGAFGVIASPRVGAFHQVLHYDIVGGQESVWTTTPTDKGSVFVVRAPEFGGEEVFFATEGAERDLPTDIVVYRQVGGVWTPVHTIRPPGAFPFVVSPEPFEWNGRSYISFLASRGARNTDDGDAEVWIAALDPAVPLLRRVSLTSVGVRKDPEAYTGGAQPWVYYTRVRANRQREIRRCDLGL